MLQEFDGVMPRVHETAWVHESAWLIGEVEIGAEASVWPTAVLRGDMGPIRVGRLSNIQDGTICHDTTDMSQTMIGERVTVGHRAVLHGCVIEDFCLVGMGAVVMDNVVVGTGSLIGAGAVLPPGRVIPPGSLVLGAPAKVVRAVNERDRRMIDDGWRSYADKVRRWRELATAR